MQSGTYRVSQTWKFPPPLAHASICKLPREPFSIYGGKETLHLLMTTYCQDIMTNFSCVRDRSTVFTHFSG